MAKGSTRINKSFMVKGDQNRLENCNVSAIKEMEMYGKIATGTFDRTNDGKIFKATGLTSGTALSGSEFIPSPTGAFFIKLLYENSWARQFFDSYTMQQGITETIPKITTGMSVDYQSSEIKSEDTADYYDETDPKTSSITFTLRTLTINLQVQNKFVDYNAIPNVESEIREWIQNEMISKEEDVFVNGDNSSTTSANINNAYNAANHSHGVGTAIYQNKHLTSMNGLRKLATGTTVSVGNAAVSLTNFRKARSNLGAKAGKDPNNVAYIISFDTMMTVMGFSQLETLEKYGPQATILAGEVARLDGSRVIVSNAMPSSDRYKADAATVGSHTLTDTAGNRSSTLGNNACSEGICMYRSAVLIGNPRPASRRFSLVKEIRNLQDRFHLIGRWDVAFAAKYPEYIVRIIGIAV